MLVLNTPFYLQNNRSKDYFEFFFAVAKKIVNKMQQVTGKEFVASMMFGVMIEHAHLHLLPTTKGSVQRVWDAWEEARGMRKLKPDQLEKIAKKFRLN